MISIASEIDFDIDEQFILMRTGHGGEILKGGKIDGSYAGYVDRMSLKYIEYNMRIYDGSDVIVIDSFDGAENLKSNKKWTYLISFSSHLFTPQMINLGQRTCCSSLNILTWQQ